MDSSIQSQKFSMGLLTTVAQLPPKYKIRYLARATMIESPLDLTVKLSEFPKLIETESQNKTEKHERLTTKSDSGPISSLLSPPKKRYRDEDFYNEGFQLTKQVKRSVLLNITDCDAKESPPLSQELTPKKPIKIESAPRTSKSHPNNPPKDKKGKAIRKLKFDEYQSSPVSGTVIRALEEINEIDDHESGDIDPQYNIVEVTTEAKAELALIKNVIGSYTCKLCRQDFEDAFGLARHRCSCIVLLEYRCPECGKRFNCPANLASHRRWHKPKEEVLRKQRENSENEPQFSCVECGKQFKRQAYLRKHLATHNKTNEKKKKTIHGGLSSKADYSELINENSIFDESQNSLVSSTASQTESANISTVTSYKILPMYKYDSDSRSSECSSPGRLQIIDTLTEEENIAATALTNLGRWNGPSVIQHANATMAY